MLNCRAKLLHFIFCSAIDLAKLAARCFDECPAYCVNPAYVLFVGEEICEPIIEELLLEVKHAISIPFQDFLPLRFEQFVDRRVA